jgi:hypothetical protein
VLKEKMGCKVRKKRDLSEVVVGQGHKGQCGGMKVISLLLSSRSCKPKRKPRTKLRKQVILVTVSNKIVEIGPYFEGPST